MRRFQIGAEYTCSSGFDPVAVERRTDKTVWVRQGGHGWQMRIRTDDDGNEYAVDTRTAGSKRNYWAMTYRA